MASRCCDRVRGAVPTAEHLAPRSARQAGRSGTREQRGWLKSRFARRSAARPRSADSASWPSLIPLSALTLAALSVALPGAQTPERGKAEELRQRASQRIRALQREGDALAARERTLLGDLRRLEVERDLRNEEVQQADAELAATIRQVDDTNRQVEEFEKRLAAERPVLVARLVDTYKLGQPGYARLLLELDDVRAVGRAYRLVAGMAALDRRRVAEYQNTLASLRAARALLDVRTRVARSLQEAKSLAREAAERAVAERAAFIREIDARRDLTAKLVGELQQAQDRLQRMIAAMTLSPGSQPPVDPAVLPLHAFRGDLPWPATGRVTALFGEHRNPRFGTATVQNGIEIATPGGARATAVHGGRVAFADVFEGYGQLVILDHGNREFTLYGYLSTLSVSQGARVEAGQTVGTVGRAPDGTPGLYFELRIDAKPVDPVQWFKRD
jgi:murein hydrolase activator